MSTLQSFVTGGRFNAFIIDGIAYYGDVQDDNSFSSSNVKQYSNYYDMANKKIVHCLYKQSRTKLKSGSQYSEEFINDDKNVDIYLPYSDNGGYRSMCTTGQEFLGLTYQTTNAPAYLSTQFNAATEYDYSYKYSILTSQLDVQMYISPAQILESSDSYSNAFAFYSDAQRQQKLSAIFQLSNSINACNVNYLVDIQSSNSNIDYMKKYIDGDFSITKNWYDYDYSICCDGTSLKQYRNYLRVGYCGNAFLIYRNLSAYSNLDQLEVVESFNKYKSAAKHKTNLYSVEIVDSGINNGTYFDKYENSEQIKKNLRAEVKHMVRSVVDSICPANTQLFDVYFTGK